MKKIIINFSILLLLGIIFSCERDYTNPWDSKAHLSPSEWAPQNLQVEDINITEKKLTWTYDDKNIEGFKLDRKKGDEPWQIAYQTLPKEARSWNDTEIIPDPSLTYSYRVYAYAGSNNSAEQNTSASAAITAPNNLQTEKLTDKSYKLTWTDNSTGEQGFKIDRKIDENNWSIAYGTVAENQSSFTDTNIFRATNVEYRVYAFYESYESSKTTTNTTAKLAAPSNLQLEKINDKSYQLQWTDNSDSEEGFKIDRKVDNGNWTKAYGEVTTNQQSFIDTNVFRAKNIEYSVYAFTGNVESTSVNANTNAELTPPDNLQITQHSITSVTLNWRDNNTGEEGFKIERKYEGESWESLVAVTTNKYEDNDFDLNTQVYYRVCAYVNTYNSTWAEKDFDATIPPPTDMQITNNSITSITLAWQDNCTGEDGYKIERKYEGGNWGELATVTSNNYEDTDFELNTLVYYRVCAYYESFTSSWIEKNFNASIPPPENLNITANSATSVTLSWDYNFTGHEGFRIDRKINEGAWEEGFAITGQKSFTDNGIDLMINDYSYRLYAYYQSFYSYKIENIIVCICGSTFIDSRDGNEYETVRIGDQCWLKKNLAYLPSVSPSSNGSQTSNYYYVYDYQGTNVTEAKATANYQTYGVIYNWRASLTACPPGWHLPADAEWTVLTNYLGGNSVAGGKMKEVGTVHWNSPNTGATNSSDFTALPGGYRLTNGIFSDRGYYGYWWSSTEDSYSSAWRRRLTYSYAAVTRYANLKEYGFSVRCVRDE